MGVPKFFRYISERYPCLSELVKEYQIPEFDNLYLDMNGIIHMCSHPDDGNPHFRITEEKIFKDIFHYIEVLFRMIKPRKVFFMAVDGVAPRAKMNQQRGRRFRSAKDAEKQEADALKKGEKLPEQARFDSNCITPGTVFMARLHEQLKYFVVDKISNDKSWQKCKVILSGHETPGEGEHKIMDYIRYIRSRPGHDPNTRHCLYGLDADLIMLGLCTHEPHFSLLREEVKFGKKSNSKRTAVPEETTFFLLHLSLMREYLELEFAQLKDKLKGFSYDIEKIIDDWVLMGFLVGNDFIPHLPNLHIANGALPVLYKAYMDALPELDGYINEGGTLNLKRFETFMEKLSSIDLENFEEIRDDLLYMEAKTGRKQTAHAKVSTRNLEAWKPDDGDDNFLMTALEPEQKTYRDSSLAALLKSADDLCIESDNDEGEYLSEEDEAFDNYKKEYYMNKLEYAKVTPEVMRDQAEGYVRAIQWNLNYYYNGCCSWSWYYPHHYAPYISDIKGFSDLKIEFDLGRPFLPYEQLLAVLPTASKELLPTAYHGLMTDDYSLIKKYYPVDFQTDLNGKKQEWEAVVLVPFIDENLLLEAMGYCNGALTEEEKSRNRHGPMLIYTYTPRDKGVYQCPEYFLPVMHCHAEMERMNYNDVLVPREKLVKGAYPGVKMGRYYPGFPTMKHLKYKGSLCKAKIKVFEQPSRNENMIITIIPDSKLATEKVPADLLGTSVFVGWPHLVEAKVVAVSNSKMKFVNVGGPRDYNVEHLTATGARIFKDEVTGSKEYFQRRMGIEVGETKVLVYVQKMIGRRYMITSNGRVTLEKQFANDLSRYPLQTVIYNIDVYDSELSYFREVEHLFPKGAACFSLWDKFYGCPGVVLDCNEFKSTGRLRVNVLATDEPDFSSLDQLRKDIDGEFKNPYLAAKSIACPTVLYAKLTGSVFLTCRNREGGLKSINIGLDLKMNKKNKETPGYSKKVGNTWYYSEQTTALVAEYCRMFPEVTTYIVSEQEQIEIDVEKIFGDEWEEKTKSLQNWLKSLPSNAVERQTCGTSILPLKVIKALEELVDAHNPPSKRITMQLKPHFIYRSENQNGTLLPDPKTETYLLDRIINVREGFSVPVALKGTVIGIHEPATPENDRDRMFDVLFDKPFNGGMALGCSEGRGYRLPPTAFINMSFGQQISSKDGKKEQYPTNEEEITDDEDCSKTVSVAERKYHPHYQPPKEDMQPQYQMPPNKMDKNYYPGQPLMHLPAAQPQYNQANSSSSAFVQFSQRPRAEYVDPRTAGQFYPMPPNNVGPPPVMPYQYHVPHMYQQPPMAPMRPYIVPQRPHNMMQRPQMMPQQAIFGQNNFMPQFVNPGIQQHVPQQPMVVNKENIQESVNKTDVNAKAVSSETDFLKSLLKVGEPVKEDKQPKKNSQQPPTTSHKGAEKQNTIDFSKLAQIANTPASIRLMTYYQSNGLGTPRYQYFNSGNLIQAQICIGKESFTGAPAQDREGACENVAKDVLEHLISKANSEQLLNNNFPSPPRTWVQPEIKEKVKQTTHIPSCAQSKIEATAVLSKSFVPLQAVKNHIRPSNSSSNSSKGSCESKENVVLNVAADSRRDEKVMKAQGTGEDSGRPKKSRKPRIAAKFVNNN